MATPVFLGSARRYANADNLVISNVTSAANDIVLVWCALGIGVAGIVLPSSITGHAGAGGDAWQQVGSGVQHGGSGKNCASLWVCRSAGATADITVALPSGVATVLAVKYTGASQTGNALAAINQYDDDSQYATNLALNLPGAVQASIEFWQKEGSAAFGSTAEEGTFLGGLDGRYGAHYLSVAYTDPGDTTPTVVHSSASNMMGVVVEMKAVGNIGIDNVDTDNIIRSDQLDIAVNLDEGGNGATAIKLKWSAIEVTQSGFSIITDLLLNFDATQGNIPFGAIQCVVVAGASQYTANITLTPPALNNYIVVVDPLINDPILLSILDSAPGPAPVDGDQIEITDPTGTITLFASGAYEIAPGGAASFNARRWSVTTEVWGDWVEIQTEENPGSGAAVSGASSASGAGVIWFIGTGAAIAGASAANGLGIIYTLVMGTGAAIAGASSAGGVGVVTLVPITGTGAAIAGASSAGGAGVIGFAGAIYAPDFRVIKSGGDKHCAKIYANKMNSIRLQLFNDGVVYNLGGVVRLVFTVLNPGVADFILDSDISPNDVDWSIGDGIVSLRPGDFAVEDEKIYNAKLEIYLNGDNEPFVMIDPDTFTIEGA